MNGKLWIWGKGDGGRLGFGHEDAAFVPTLNPYLILFVVLLLVEFILLLLLRLVSFSLGQCLIHSAIFLKLNLFCLVNVGMFRYLESAVAFILCSC